MAELDQRRQDVFLKLKPVCVPLLSFPNISRPNQRPIRDALNALLDTLRAISEPSTIFTKALVDYVLFPLLELYKRRQPQEPLPDTVAETWLRCLLFLLEECGWNRTLEPEIFKQLFILFTLSAGGPLVRPNDPKLPRPSEETTLVAVRCLSAILPRAHCEGKIPDSEEESAKRLDLLDALRAEVFRPSVGHCVAVLLDVVMTERLLELRLAALGSLSQLLTDNLRDADVLASFLPGVASAMCKVVVRDKDKEHHRVISAAVGLLGDVVVAVMNDEANAEFVTRATKLSDLRNFVGRRLPSAPETKDSTTDEGSETSTALVTSSSTPPKIFTATRTRHWLAATQTQLKRLLTQTLTARDHPDWSTRMHFVDFSYTLLLQCALTLELCAPNLIETLVLHLDDDYAPVAARCREHLLALSRHPEFAASLVPILKSRLDDWMFSLARHLTSADEAAKCSALSLIAGLLALLGAEARSVLETSLEKVAGGWLRGLEMDDVNVKVERAAVGRFAELEYGRGSVGTADGDGDGSQGGAGERSRIPRYPTKRFGYLVSDRAVEGASRLFRTLGRVGDAGFLVEHFMRYLRSGQGGIVETGSYQPQAAWVVNEILLGADGFGLTVPAEDPSSSLETSNDTPFASQSQNTNSERQVRSLAKQILRELISLEILTAPTSVLDKEAVIALHSQFDPSASTPLTLTTTRPSTDIIPTPSLNATILTICHMLECVATTSLILGPAFKLELIDALYPLLDQLGSQNARISFTASITLDAVARACGYWPSRPRATPTQALVLGNVDYVVNTVSDRLARVPLDPRAPRVMTAVVRVGGGSVIEYMGDSVQEIFDALDAYHMNGWMCAELCGVLREVVRVVENEDILQEKEDGANREEGGAKEGLQEQQKGGVSQEISGFVARYKGIDFGDGYQRESRVETKAMNEIGQYFLEQQQKKDKVKELDEEDLEKLASEAEREQNRPPSSRRDSDTDRKIPPTRNQQTVLDILHKTIHFLTAPSPHLRSQILSLIESALPVLRPRPQDLNPLVHKIWPSVVRRLDDKEHFVILNAVHLVQCVAECCGDFLSRRVVDDLWPRFKVMLRERVREAEAEERRTGITMTAALVANPNAYSVFTRAHRLQRSVLQTLALVAEHVPLKDGNVLEIVTTCAPYLDAMRWHDELQRCGVRLFIALGKGHADAVWLGCCGLVEELWKRKVDDGVVVRDGRMVSEVSETGLKEFAIPQWLRKEDVNGCRENVDLVLASLC
ncbi:armadillo-type protein [Jimgerdemannia flammicorona]|uniref:Armadillo-type protein n=1 Tax=Jimgerdemannia flammicorona TaxID=994334 RepID=A0A433DAL3_9FUNG|nr:armadillo-type protein [Jimgerdemannia flammicorona]